MPGVGMAAKAVKSAGKPAGRAAKRGAPVDLVGTGRSTSGRKLPPANPPVDPPADPPVDPPADPPVDPPADPPVDPPADPGRTVQVPGVVNSAGGFVLGLMFWTWVALPFLFHGPSGVRDTLRAKFFNKAPDGSWLP